MQDGFKPITPAHAFRLLLRDRYPERPALADEIDGAHWFRDRQWRPPIEGSTEAAECKAAFETLNDFYRYIERHEIRLRGVSRSDNNAREIDAIEQAIGDLDIWNQTIDCRQHSHGNVYQNVWAHEGDVERIISLPPSSAPECEELPKTRLQKIIDKELPFLRSMPRRPKRENLVDDIKQRHDLSGADAEAVVKVIWDGTGEPGRPSVNKS